MKLRNVIALIAAFIVSVSSASASGLLDENDLLGSSGKNRGHVIAFKPMGKAGCSAKEVTLKNNESSKTIPTPVVESTKEDKNNKNTPSKGTFDLLQPNGAYLLLLILVYSIAKLVR